MSPFTFITNVSHSTLTLMACLCISGSITPAQADPNRTQGKPIGRIGSITGTITWSKVGDTNTSRKVSAYLAALHKSRILNIFGSTNYTDITSSVQVRMGSVLGKGGDWTQTYELVNAPVGQAIAVMVDARKVKGVGPSTDYDRTSDPQWATCTSPGALAVTHFDFKKRALSR